MMIVGQISNPEEAKEVELIVKNLVVANRVKALTKKINITNFKMGKMGRL